MKHIFGVLSVFGVIVLTAFLSVSIVDEGCNIFNHPNYPLADAVGLMGIGLGVACFFIGVWTAIRLATKLWRKP